MTLEIISYIGGFLLAACGAPEAWKSYKTKTCAIGYPMLLSWLIGEVSLAIYESVHQSPARWINYGANIFFISVMLYYKSRSK